MDTPDTKQQLILASARQVFSSYGFRKTSMDDIARGANMSRPAVYLHYKNKEAIFRSLIEQYYLSACRDVQDALNGNGSVALRLEKAFLDQGGQTMEALMTSPHGLELLDVVDSVAGEMIVNAEADLARVYSVWLEKAAAEGRVSLPAPAPECGRAITVALKGAKITAQTYDGYRQTLKTLAGMFAQGLTPD